MTSEQHKTYPSKLLLFGEYSIIRGSGALAVPHGHYGGTWDWAERDAAVLQQNLASFAEWLKDQPVATDHQRFQQDLAKGLYFCSNIPVGYGLGSSGAVVAAVYERYARHPISPDRQAEFPQLQAELASLERFFHASSSGIDPLISYVGHPVLRTHSGKVEVLSNINWPQEFRFFLIDTGISRQTGPLVENFQEKCQSTAYLNAVETQLKPAVDAAIQAFLQGEENTLFAATDHISRFQLIHFRDMIPEEFLPIWMQSLESDNCRIKLCGAGGGGFLLGLCRKNADPGQWLSSPWEWVK